MNNDESATATPLTHFVGRSLPDDEQRFEQLVKIVRSGWLTHPPHDQTIAAHRRIYPGRRLSENALYDPMVVCFCDIGLDGGAHLRLHMSKYSRFGLAFPKPFLVARGATPALYVAADSQIPRKRAENASMGHLQNVPPDEAAKLVQEHGS